MNIIKYYKHTFTFFLTLVFAALMLTACGGGGGGGSGGSGGDDGGSGGGNGSGGGAATPPVTAALPSLATAQTKIFRLTWTDVGDATFYRLLENPDGASGYTQVEVDIPQGTEGYDHVVPLHRRVNAQYILQSCNSAGCTDSPPLFVNGTLATAVGYFKASNMGAGDRFGYSVAVSADGSTLAVGAPSENSSATSVNGNEDDNSVLAAGAVYIFTRTGTTWIQQAYVKASNTGAGDYFGNSVALSGDGSTLAVGAYREESNATGVNGDEANNSALGAGAVYIFTRTGNTWIQQAYVKASNTRQAGQFGYSLTLSGNGSTLAMGAPGENSNATGVGGNETDNSISSAGAVYVFTRNAGGVWTQQAYVKASNTEKEGRTKPGSLFGIYEGGDMFGWSVALSADGSTLAVGAIREDSNATGVGGDQADNTADNSGAVYVFTHDADGVWMQQAYVKASNTGAEDSFGLSVALSGDGSTMVVGAYLEGSNSGAVYVFTRDTNSDWIQQAYVKASNKSSGDYFGNSVALSGDGSTLAVGAPGEDSNATGVGGNQADAYYHPTDGYGAVYVFTRDAGGTWTQQTYVKASNTGWKDLFGMSVALSGDGSILAVGAYSEDSSATGVNGDQDDNSAGDAGAVYLY